jgi:hypothetical protein
MMEESSEAGIETLVFIYKSLQNLHKTLFDQAVKIQVLDVTLMAFDQTYPVYESALERARTPSLTRKSTSSKIRRKHFHGFATRFFHLPQTIIHGLIYCRFGKRQ